MHISTKPCASSNDAKPAVAFSIVNEDNEQSGVFSSTNVTEVSVAVRAAC